MIGEVKLWPPWQIPKIRRVVDLRTGRETYSYKHDTHIVRIKKVTDLRTGV